MLTKQTRPVLCFKSLLTLSVFKPRPRSLPKCCESLNATIKSVILQLKSADTEGKEIKHVVSDALQYVLLVDTFKNVIQEA